MIVLVFPPEANTLHAHCTMYIVHAFFQLYTIQMPARPIFDYGFTKNVTFGYWTRIRFCFLYPRAETIRMKVGHILFNAFFLVQRKIEITILDH